MHITTVNDYLAGRDAEWMGPIYTTLGLTVGVLQQQMPDAARSEAYRRDITYGTASEFGFDFPRPAPALRRQGRGRPVLGSVDEELPAPGAHHPAQAL